jgi:hypothetical protein
MTNVATLMIGQQLKSGWTIRALKPTLSTATGGCFSYCFLATNDKCAGPDANRAGCRDGASEDPTTGRLTKFHGVSRDCDEIAPTIFRSSFSVSPQSKPDPKSHRVLTQHHVAVRAGERIVEIV